MAIILPDASYEVHTKSKTFPTSSPAFQCQVVVFRQTSFDTNGNPPAQNEYLCTLVIIRNATTKRYAHNWSTRYIIDNYDSGIQPVVWPDNNYIGPNGYFDMLANHQYQVFAFRKVFNNDGSKHTLSMLASCDDTVPRDCNVVGFTFTTATRKITPDAPTNIRRAEKDFSDKSITIAWDPANNATKYSVRFWVRYPTDNKFKILSERIITDCSATFKFDSMPVGTVYYCDVAAISSTNNYSNYIITAQHTYGNMARVKTDDTWAYARAYIKSQNDFKSVHTVWVKADGTWKRVLDD